MTMDNQCAPKGWQAVPNSPQEQEDKTENTYHKVRANFWCKLLRLSVHSYFVDLFAMVWSRLADSACCKGHTPLHKASRSGHGDILPTTDNSAAPNVSALQRVHCNHCHLGYTTVTMTSHGHFCTTVFIATIPDIDHGNFYFTAILAAILAQIANAS